MDLSIRYTQLEGSSSVESVVGLDHLDVLPATSADWDITPDNLGKRLKAFGYRVVGGSTPAGELANWQSELPSTHLFRTPIGNEGVLQIVAFTRDPASVKLRYKLAQGMQTDAAASPSIKPPRLAAPPVVIKTIPESGASGVDPNLTELQVTFSKPMHEGDPSWSTSRAENFPETTEAPRYLDDRRTCVLPVRLRPGKGYALWLNSENPQNFRDRVDVPAVPYLLIFETRK